MEREVLQLNNTNKTKQDTMCILKDDLNCVTMGSQAFCCYI